jgi:hypothetical protein
MRKLVSLPRFWKGATMNSCVGRKTLTLFRKKNENFGKYGRKTDLFAVVTLETKTKTKKSRVRDVT